MLGEVILNTSATPAHIYAFAGNFTVTLTVIDNDGLTGIDTTTAEITDSSQTPGADDDDVHSTDMFIANIRLNNDGILQPGESLITTVKLENIGDVDLEDVRVTVSVPDLGLRIRDGPFDVDNDDEAFSRTILPLYDALPGEYYVRVTIANHQFVRTKHRPLTILG